MLILKDFKCKCGGDVSVVTFTDEKNHKTYVDYGICVDCMQIHVLPSEDMNYFYLHCTEKAD